MVFVQQPGVKTGSLLSTPTKKRAELNVAEEQFCDLEDEDNNQPVFTSSSIEFCAIDYKLPVIAEDSPVGM
ncbi:hypothetical protein B566_EDAN010297 [Ephemera danica]|nr:hypothetical protein B566_EDAN010297 [Ephemera danica]